MIVQLTKKAKKDLAGLAPQQQKRVAKQFSFLQVNLRHPSLNAKKFPEGGAGVWQARVNRSYRFYFLVEDEAYVILRVTPHPK